MEDRRRSNASGAAAAAAAAGKKRTAAEEAEASASAAAAAAAAAGNDSATNKNIAEGFADLKRGLANVTEAEWEAIPEIGDYTIKKAKRDTWAPVPDTLLAKAAAEMASTSTTVVEENASSSSASALPADGSAASLAPGGSLTAVGEGRRTVVSLKLDSAADSVSGQTVVDPRGYLTSLSSQRISSAAEVGDIKKARTLLRSVTATNPRHAPGWVAAARLEEVAGKLADAKALAAKGCELCPRSEDVWLEASRLAANNGDAKAALARAVGALPRSVRLWLAAAELEQEQAAKARVVRRALERVPASLKLWKAAVELAPTDDDARVLLARAVECCPQHVELWLALARLETHEGARKVLNRARLAVPTDASIWVTASKLEEAHGKTEMVPKIVERAVKSLRANSVVIDREAWIKVREKRRVFFPFLFSSFLSSSSAPPPVVRFLLRERKSQDPPLPRQGSTVATIDSIIESIGGGWSLAKIIKGAQRIERSSRKKEKSFFYSISLRKGKKTKSNKPLCSSAGSHIHQSHQTLLNKTGRRGGRGLGLPGHRARHGRCRRFLGSRGRRQREDLARRRRRPLEEGLVRLREGSCRCHAGCVPGEAWRVEGGRGGGEGSGKGSGGGGCQGGSGGSGGGRRPSPKGGHLLPRGEFLLFFLSFPFSRSIHTKKDPSRGLLFVIACSRTKIENAKQLRARRRGKQKIKPSLS